MNPFEHPVTMAHRFLELPQVRRPLRIAEPRAGIFAGRKYVWGCDQADALYHRTTKGLHESRSTICPGRMTCSGFGGTSAMARMRIWNAICASRL